MTTDLSPESNSTTPKRRVRDFWGHGEPAWKVTMLAVLWALVAGAVGFQVGRLQEPDIVFRTPGDEDLIVVNGCVVSACNYLASVRSQHKLDPQFWSRVMLVRYENNSAGHAYCVWETDGRLFGYDRNAGGYPIPTETRDPKGIAQALAGELGKVLQKQLIVSSAEFIEPAKTRIHAFK